MSAELIIAIAQGNPTVGDIEGNVELIRPPRAEAAAAGADLVVYPSFARRLPARGSGAEAGLARPRPARGRAAGGRDRRRRAGADRRRPLARQEAGSTTPLPAAGRRDRRPRRQARAAELRRVRREAGRSPPARCPGRWPCRCRAARAPARASWSARTCGPRTWPRPWPRAGPRSCSSPTARPSRHEQAGRAPAARGGAGDRDRAAADLRQPGGRPGRAGLRRRLLRARRRAERWWRSRRASTRTLTRHQLAARHGRAPGAASSAASIRAAVGARGDLPGHGAGPARLRGQEPLSRAWCWACRAASIPRSRPRSRSTRWGRSGCAR